MSSMKRLKERCQWSGEDYKLVVRGVRTAVDPDLFAFLAAYEIGKDNKDITDEDILAKVKERCETMNSDYLSNPSALFSQQLKMDLTIKDVPDRVAKYFRLFERIIADNGFQENLGRGNATDDNYVARMICLDFQPQRGVIHDDGFYSPLLYYLIAFSELWENPLPATSVMKERLMNTSTASGAYSTPRLYYAFSKEKSPACDEIGGGDYAANGIFYDHDTRALRSPVMIASSY